MEKKITTRITALTAALAVIASSAASCGKKSDDNNKEKTAQKLLSASYRATEIETDIKLDNIESIKRIDDDTILIDAFDTAKNEVVLYTTDNDFSAFNEIDVDLGIDENADVDLEMSPSLDGQIMAVATFTDYGDMKKPDPSDPDFDPEKFDYEALRKNAKYDYKIYTVDLEGNLLSQNKIEGLMEEDDEEPVHIGDITACGDGKALLNVFSESGKKIVVNSEGKIEKEFSIDGMEWIDSFISLPDGKIAVTGSNGNEQFIKTLDAKTFETSGDDIKLEGTDVSNIGGLFVGNEKYPFFANSSTGLVGIDEKGNATEVINWVDSDLSEGNVSAILPVGEDEFIAWYSMNGKGSFYKLSKRDASDLENTNVITLGVLYDDWQINEKVSEFNKTHDDTRIKIEDYSKYDKYDDESGETISSALGQLKKDIVAGKAPDMIAASNTSLTLSLQNKGLFVDLYEFLDKDPDLKKEDIMPNVLKASERNGKLLSLSPSFYINTYIAKKQFVDTPDWSVDQMIETYEKLPKDMKLTTLDCKEQILVMMIFTLNECIDYEKGTCNFDTPEFKKLVDFCEKFPSEDEIIDWEDEDSFSELMSADNYIKNKVLLSELYLTNFNEYIQEIKGKFNNEPITFVGYPSTNGHGGILSMNQNFSILSNASDKEACWNLIKEFFKPADENAEDNGRMMGMRTFPSLRSEFEKIADESMKKPTYVDDNGKTVEEDITYNIGDKEVVLEPLTQEERDFVVDYIMNTSRTAYDFDPEVEKVLEEEMMAYMKGEKNASEVLELLQSRISLIVSEQS